MVMVLWLQVLCVTGAAVPDTCVVVPSCPSCRSSACLRHLPFQGSRTTLEVCMARLAARIIFVIVARIEVYFYHFSKQFFSILFVIKYMFDVNLVKIRLII